MTAGTTQAEIEAEYLFRLQIIFICSSVLNFGK